MQINDEYDLSLINTIKPFSLKLCHNTSSKPPFPIQLKKIPITYYTSNTREIFLHQLSLIYCLPNAMGNKPQILIAMPQLETKEFVTLVKKVQAPG